MEPEGPLPHLQEPSTGPVLSQTNPIHTTQSYFSKIRLNIINLISLGLPSGFFPYGFLINNMYSFYFSPFVLHTLPNSSLLT
jgi:hypothetical protein